MKIIEGLPKNKWLRFLLFFMPIKSRIMHLDGMGNRHITKQLFGILYCIKIVKKG